LDHRLSEVNRLVDDECATFRNSAALRLLNNRFAGVCIRGVWLPKRYASRTRSGELGVRERCSCSKHRGRDGRDLNVAPTTGLTSTALVVPLALTRATVSVRVARTSGRATRGAACLAPCTARRTVGVVALPLSACAAGVPLEAQRVPADSRLERGIAALRRIRGGS
jgi:hypothetical protein